MDTVPDLLTRAEKLPKEILGGLPLGMRRCFMTGRHCISRSGIEGSAACGDETTVFVVMPFRPQLNAFYDWSLKPLLVKSGVPEEQIRRADQISRTGYVMCGSICRHIQQATLVIVDLSTRNANVYYELGLAVGLGKSLIITVEENTQWQDQVGALLQVHRDHILTYQGVSSLQRYADSLVGRLHVVQLHPLGRSMSLVPLMVRDPEDERIRRQGEIRQETGDIRVGFSDALRAAIDVAVESIGKPAKGIIRGLDENDRDEFMKCQDPAGVREKGGKPKPFDTLRKDVDRAFACVIDLADEDELAYFWLGYCHARGINAIPVVRRTRERRHRVVSDIVPDAIRGVCPPGERSTDPDAQRRIENEGKQERLEEPILAFDIRALWYMKHNPKDTKQLAKSLQNVLEQVVIRDVPTRHRRAFWERLTRKSGLNIYTGSFHHGELHREVVGDWDLRTVSELVRYLSSTEESVVPQLETPVYAPETIAQKLSLEKAASSVAKRGQKRRNASLTQQQRTVFIDLLKRELADKNCLIVASAESNPYTEVVLAYAYAARALKTDEVGQVCFTEPPDIDAKWVVALKGKPSKSSASARELPHEQPRLRCFSRPVIGKHPSPGCRGYICNVTSVVEEAYHAQDETFATFMMPAHFLITYNPFSNLQRGGSRDHLIVVLNGVSGPGTFALAQALTGGTSPTMAMESERTLKIINELWDDNNNNERFHGVEGFLRVEISPRKRNHGSNTRIKDRDKAVEGAAKSEAEEVERKFFDEREVQDWCLVQDDTFPRPLIWGSQGRPSK